MATERMTTAMRMPMISNAPSYFRELPTGDVVRLIGERGRVPSATYFRHWARHLRLLQSPPGVGTAAYKTRVCQLGAACRHYRRPHLCVDLHPHQGEWWACYTPPGADPAAPHSYLLHLAFAPPPVGGRHCAQLLTLQTRSPLHSAIAACQLVA